MKVFVTLEIEIDRPVTKAGKPVGDVIEDRAITGVKYVDGVVSVRSVVSVLEPPAGNDIGPHFGDRWMRGMHAMEFVREVLP